MGTITKIYGPQDRNPDYARGERRWCTLRNASSQTTGSIVDRGAGTLWAVISNEVVASVVGLFDAVAGGTVDNTTQVVEAGTESPRGDKIGGAAGIPFDDGLQIIMYADGQDVTVLFSGGASTVSAKTFPS